jgi:hypothetical protein
MSGFDKTGRNFVTHLIDLCYISLVEVAELQKLQHVELENGIPTFIERLLHLSWR